MPGGCHVRLDLSKPVTLVVPVLLEQDNIFMGFTPNRVPAPALSYVYAVTKGTEILIVVAAL